MAINTIRRGVVRLVVYRCDKCKRIFTDEKDLRKTKIPVEDCYFQEGKYDLCNSCVEEIEKFIENDFVIYGARKE